MIFLQGNPKFEVTPLSSVLGCANLIS